MRIKSNFHDYYDKVQSFGQDDILFIRNGREEQTTNRVRFERHWNDKQNRHEVLIGFCGKVYFGCSFTYEIDKIFPKYVGKETKWTKFLFSSAKCEEFYIKQGWEYEKKPKFYSKTIHQKYEIVEQNNKEGKYNKYFDLYNAPIWIAYDSGWIGPDKSRQFTDFIYVNGCLKDYDFETVFDTYSAFQELRMWLSNKASPEKLIPKIDDVTMAEAKGFDKWSFRKEPSKRK